MDLEFNLLQPSSVVAAVEADGVTAAIVAESITATPISLPISTAPAVLPAAVITTTSNLSNNTFHPGMPFLNWLSINATFVMLGSAVLTVSAMALIIESIIVVISDGNRYTPVGLVMGLGCFITGGRGLFGNFQGSGLKSANVMIILTAISLALSIWGTYDIKQSFDLVTKRITTPHMCLNISDAYSSCDSLKTVYIYLKYSFYTCFWCIGWSFYLLILTMRIKKELMNLNRRAERIQQQNDAERQSLLGVVDQDYNANNDGDDVVSNNFQSHDHPAHATVIDMQRTKSTATSESYAEGVEMSTLPPIEV